MDLQKNSQEQGFDATENNESQVISSNTNSGNETSSTRTGTTSQSEENVLNKAIHLINHSPQNKKSSIRLKH